MRAIFLFVSALSILTFGRVSFAEAPKAAATIVISGALDFSCALNGNKGSLLGIKGSNRGKILNPKTETNKLKLKTSNNNSKIAALRKAIAALKRQKQTAKIQSQIAAKLAQILKLQNQNKGYKIIIAGIKDCVNGVLKEAVCGNGILESGEQCDDGNQQNGDCCSNTCTLEAAGSSCTSTNATNCGQCNATGQCVASANSGSCNDRDACTTGDTCNAGVCSGAPVVCPPRAHSSSNCNLGVCALTCDPGFIDANNDPSDGCEAAVCGAGQKSCNGVCKDISSDRNNCGSCGTVCSGNQVCSSGFCTSCPQGQFVCGGSCVNTANDLNNCGACGNTCATRSQSSPLCILGNCGFLCSAGFGDCNAQAADGCEKPLTNDVLNCGACGKTCAANNGTASCSNGTCGVAGCNAGFANCDNNAANGCEANLQTDVNNCGGCGLVCPSGTNFVPSCSNTCGGACSGSNFDVDKNLSNGCEVADPIPGAHTQASAFTLGTMSCNDGEITSFINFKMPSDSRQHANPAISNFNSATGAAPDWSVLHASGGVCTNDIYVTLTTTGGGSTACYQLTIFTDKNTVGLAAIGGNNSINFNNNGSPGFYSDNTDVYFKVEKICSLPVQENVTYSLQIHL